MSMLEKFKTFNFNEGIPYISITKNGIRFSKGVVMKLKYPQYVIFLINENSQQIALQVCDKKTPNATVFYKQKKTNTQKPAKCRFTDRPYIKRRA